MHFYLCVWYCRVRLYPKIGKYLDEGLAEGIEDNARGPIDTIRDLTEQIIAIVQQMNQKVNAELVKTVNDVAYVAETDYAAAMLNAENIEEFEGLAKQRAAKIAGEGIDLAAQGWASNEELLKQWSENMAKQTAAAIEDTVVVGKDKIDDPLYGKGDYGYDEYINLQVNLDGKVIGETSYKYMKQHARAVGAWMLP